jgi:hypothetical protein
MANDTLGHDAVHRMILDRNRPGRSRGPAGRTRRSPGSRAYAAHGIRGEGSLRRVTQPCDAGDAAPGDAGGAEAAHTEAGLAAAGPDITTS